MITSKTMSTIFFLTIPGPGCSKTPSKFRNFQGVCKTLTGYLRWRMRMGKCGLKNTDGKKMRITKKVRRKTTRNADNEKKKTQTNKQLGKEIFLSSSCHMVGPFNYIQNVTLIVGTAGFVPCNSFY